MLNGALLVRCSRDLVKYSQCLSLGAILWIPFYGRKDMEPKKLARNEEWYNFKSPTELAYEVIEEGLWETDDEEEVDVEGIEGYKSESSDDDDEIEDEVLGSENDD
ncbi:hypothetical protein RHMOL_Rhmol01G0323200 [Rhododendron molle]|uniref:Uncharacterized protein n=1 Tax=Rhododendron molle TaxID=49168 RepID=A0ACC0Q9Z5_RHOML|nr:hypothetical protein RHMOL_Rhmol01G0323200 [Rhododendron molle]